MKTAGRFIIALITLALGCANPTQQNNEDGNKTVEASKSIHDVSRGALWNYDYDTSINRFIAYKQRPFISDTLTPQVLIYINNETWPNVQIQYLSTSNDTICIAIPNSEVLTQQMGSAGAEQFIVSTTYSFTELPGIKYVTYRFEPGDHANPGTYSRHS